MLPATAPLVRWTHCQPRRNRCTSQSGCSALGPHIAEALLLVGEAIQRAGERQCSPHRAHSSVPFFVGWAAGRGRGIHACSGVAARLFCAVRHIIGWYASLRSPIAYQLRYILCLSVQAGCHLTAAGLHAGTQARSSLCTNPPNPLFALGGNKARAP